MCALLSFSHSFDAREKHARRTINNVSDTRPPTKMAFENDSRRKKWTDTYTRSHHGFLSIRFDAADFCFVWVITDADELMIIWLLALIWHLICVCHTVTDETVYVARFYTFCAAKFFVPFLAHENRAFSLFRCGRIQTWFEWKWHRHG